MIEWIGIILSVVSLIIGLGALLYPEEFISWQQKVRRFDAFENSEKGIRNVRLRGILIIAGAIVILVIVFAS